MNISGKKVFVTGAEGFIGSHLVERLVALGCHVRAMVLYNSFGNRGNLDLLPPSVMKSVEIYQGDVTDPFSVRKGVEGCDVVLHLASLIAIPYSYQAPQSYVSTNVMGTLNVMQACLDAGVKKVVHTSTSETYGTALYTPIDEKHPMQGQSPYSASKIGADKIAESYNLSFGLPVATIRPFNTYGPRQSARAVIPTIISQLLAGVRDIKLGSLVPVRDFTYVLDTVAGFIAVAQAEAAIGQVVNIGYGEGISIEDLAQKLIALTGSDAHVSLDKDRVRPEKSEVLKLLCDNRKAKELCGWSPSVPLDKGLGESIDFIRANQHLYRPQTYSV